MKAKAPKDAPPAVLAVDACARNGWEGATAAGAFDGEVLISPSWGRPWYLESISTEGGTVTLRTLAEMDGGYFLAASVNVRHLPGDVSCQALYVIRGELKRRSS